MSPAKWRPLTELLQFANMYQLHEMRKLYQLEGLSQLNKDKLIQALSRMLPDCYGQIIPRLTHPVYALLNTLVNKEGSAFYPSFKLLDAIDYPEGLQEMGLVFFGSDQEIHVSSELTEALHKWPSPQLKAIIQRNTEWITLTTGMLVYYGAMELKILRDKLRFYTGQEVHVFELFEVIQYYTYYDNTIDFDGHCVWHFSVDDPYWLLDEHEIRPNLDFYPFSKQQILQAGQRGHMERIPAFAELVKRIEQFGQVDRETAEEYAEEIRESIQFGASLPQIIQEISHYIPFSDMQQVDIMADVIQRLNNESRHWSLKGHTPSELGRMKALARSDEPDNQSKAEIYDFQSRKKIGRNEPCPCGSGKKFKKCCGS